MAARKLSRWQKAGALLPMVLLVGIWGAALASMGLATAAGSHDDPGLPDVPATAFDQPATVQAGTPGGIDPHAGAAGTLSTLSTNGIPAAALAAYRQAESLLAQADGPCRLGWTLLAAIGRVESDHGRSGGNTVGADGVSTPGIFGVPLTGAHGTSRIFDTDNGSLDRDAVYDRAVGPMQFLPGTWRSVAVDADGDGAKNPQDIDDAAAAAGVYLCAGSDDLSTTRGASAAVLRYNHSSSYVDLVLKIAAAYARGEYSQAPNGYGSPAVLTSKSHDQTLTRKQRDKAGKDQAAGSSAKPAGGAGGTGTTGGEDTGSGGTGTGGTGGTVGGHPGDGAVGGTTTGTIGGVVAPVTEPAAPALEPVVSVLTEAEARAKCLIVPGLFSPDFDACVDDLTH